MSNIYSRPQTLKVYDPIMPEHYLIDSMHQEYTEIFSPPIAYWKLNFKESQKNQDERNTLYGENPNGNVYEGPIEVFAIVDRSAIVQELTRMGIAMNEEINISFNKTDIIEKIGRDPVPGDLLRIAMIEKERTERFRIYKIGSVSENANNLHRYTEFIIFAEQTALADVPEEIKAKLFEE